MPVSTTVHISHCLQHILAVNPSSVLDVGCGFGLWGFLCRMHLDVANGRIQPEMWQTRIDGIEYFEPYIQRHQRALYSSLRIGDVRDLANELEPYDLIIAGDVIEHLDKDDGEVVLDQLYAKARSALMVNIPLGVGWEHPEAYGNPNELHRSVWETEDFAPYPGVYQCFELPCGRYGVFTCLKNASVELRKQGLLFAAHHHEQAGRLELAALYALRLQEVDPADADTAFFRADLLLRMGKNDQAVQALRVLVDGNPACIEGISMLVRVLRVLGRNEEAQQYETRRAGWSVT